MPRAETRIDLLHGTLDLLILRTLVHEMSMWDKLSLAMAKVLRPAE